MALDDVQKTSKFPADFDATPLEYLQYGDLVRVAKKANVTPKTVSQVLNGDTKNWKIMGLLIEQGLANKKLVQKS